MANKKLSYTLDFDAEIGDIVSKVDKVKASMQSLAATDKSGGIEKAFSSIEKSIEKMKQKIATPVESGAVFSNLQKDAAAIKVVLDNLEKAIKDISNLSNGQKIELLPPQLVEQIKAAEKALNVFSDAYDEAGKKSAELIALEKQLTAEEKKLNDLRKKQATKNTLVEQSEATLEAAKAEKTAIEEKIKVLEKYQTTLAAYDRAKAEGKTANKSTKLDYEGQKFDLPKDRAAAKKIVPDITTTGAEAALETLNAQLKEQEKVIKSAQGEVNKYSKQFKETSATLDTAETSFADLSSKVEELNKEFNKSKTKNVNTAFQKLRTEAEKLGIDLTDIPIEYTEENFTKLNEKLNQLASDGIADFNNGLKEMDGYLASTRDAVDATGERLGELGNKDDELRKKFNDNQSFISRIQQFVGLQGGVEIARKAMQNAISTIKELDAAMTEMAVVTDLGVSDYWKQLPEHTQRANALGVAIRGVYEAETLYYQQGLKTNEVVAMSNETLKMARIAGLSAEDATNKMTAALRGFNMELNETSAQRISDVYSELAAITAADVDEISSAMTKTASIASSAGMEFETTAAFLSQIIETTRESAETAGTAMKTVIARFQELKKDPAEIGEVDGEIVDANKIETALRSVGVALRDSSGQFRDLDDVFLELSSKWDSLDTNTQRYIATIAAGSRQQSRFIAMMSDYSRTSELVAAANNSAGASNEQFEKTLDSLESKFNKLKNAWDTFTMSLMDSEVLKIAIDILVQIMDTVNGIIALFDKVGAGGAASIGMVVGALYLGDKALKTFSGSMQSGMGIFRSFGAVGRAAIDSINQRFIKTKKSLTEMKKTLQENQKTMKMFGKVKIKVDTKDATKAMKDYQTATNNQTAAIKLRESVQQNSAINEETRQARLAALDKVDIANEKRKTAAVAEYASIQGLTTAQASAALMLQTMGIGQDVAEAAALGGLTATKIADYQATMIANGLSTEEVALRMTEITSLYAKVGAQTAENTTQKTGIALLWSKITAGIAHVASLVAQTVAQWAFNIAEWAGCPPTIAFAAVILILVAALAAVVAIIVLAIAGIIAFIKAIKAASPEGQLKSAEEAAEAAGEAAEKAAEQFDTLVESLDSLEDKYQALEELTEGTEEWNDAIKEINKEVLALIEQYPELAGLVDGSEGYLKLDIDSQEVQDVLNKYEQKSIKASAMSYAAKMNVNEKKQGVDYKNLSNKATLGSEAEMGMKNAIAATAAATYLITPAIGSMMAPIAIAAAADARKSAETNRENTDAMAKALADGLLDAEGNVISGKEDELAELGLTAEEAKRFREELGDGADELKKYGESIRAAEAQEKAYYQAMATNAAQAVDMSKMTTEQIAQVNNAADSDLAEHMQKKYEAEIDSASKEEKKQAKLDVARSMYGDDAKVSGDKVTYTDENGEKQTATLTDEAAKEMWAASQAAEAMTAALESVPSRINKLNSAFERVTKGAGKAYADLMTDPNSVTKGQATKLGGMTDTHLEQAWYQLSDIEKSYYESYEDYVDSIRGPIADLQATFTDAETKLTNLAGAQITLNDSFTTDSLNAYIGLMGKMSSSVGDNEAELQKFAASIDSLAASLPEEEFNALMREMNTMDIQDLNSWDQLKQNLSDMGYESLVTSSRFKEFALQCQDMAGAVEKVDLAKFTESFRDMQKIVGDIYSGEQERTIDDDIYNQLIASNKDLANDFVLTNDGYMYIGSSMNDLAAAIMENTELQRQKNISRTQDAQDVITIAEMFAEEGRDYRNSDAMTSVQDKQNYIADMVATLKANGYDVQNTLQIEGLTNATTGASLAKVSEADIETMFSDLIEFLGQDWQAEEKKQRKLAQSTMFNYDIAQNAAALQSSIDTATTINPEEANVYIESILARGEVMLAQAIQAGVEGEAIDAYRAELERISDIKNNSNLSDTDKLAALEDTNFSTFAQDLLAAANAASEITEEVEKWKTEYGYLDQLTRQIEATQREREKAERKFTKLLEDESLNQEAVLEALNEQAEILNKEANQSIQKWAEAAVALDEMTSRTGVNAEFAQYVNYDATSGTVEVDYEAAEAAYEDNTELGALFDEYISNLYELQDTAEEAQDEIADIEDQMDELKDTGKDEYSDLWTQIRDAMIKNAQDSIDKMSEVNESIQEAEASLVDQMQKQIEEQRQARENAETEENIANKEAQLAYLMMDTSGANQPQIMQLQDELSQEKQDYEDSLVDQALADLQAQNEIAAEQRQQQIDIAQAQLDAFAASQQAWAEAQIVLNYALSNEGALGLGLGELGVNMNMLLGPDGTLATSLNGLLIGDKSLNAIEQEAFEQETLNGMENASAYAAINGQLISNDENNTNGLLGLGVGLNQEFEIFGIKSENLATASNNTINDARAAITGEIVAEGALRGDDAEAIINKLSGLFTKADQEVINNEIRNSYSKTPEQVAAAGAAAEKIAASLGASGSGLMTAYDSKLKSLVEAETTKKAEEAQNRRAEQAKNFQNLINDEIQISEQQYNDLINSGALAAQGESGYKSFSDYYREWSAQEESRRAVRQKQASANANASLTLQKEEEAKRAESSSEPVFDEYSADAIQAKMHKTNAVLTNKGNNWNWDDVATGKVEEGSVKINDTDGIRLQTCDSANGLLPYAINAGISGNSVFYYSGGKISADSEDYPAGYYILNADRSKAGRIYKDKADFSKFSNMVTKYKTGGLADYTGPAWLDGTKSHPELVLNATDTANFIQLKDILADIMSNGTYSSTTNSQSSGDNYFEVQINVESIEDDYDVEQMANKIREMIYEDSMYRNVNAISMTR